MQKRKLDNQELDTIGKRLLAASRLTETEIDYIASAPGSFKGVLGRIRNSETPVDRKIGFAGFLLRHRAIAGTSFAALLCISAFALFVQQGGTGLVSNTIHTPAKQRDEARPTTPQVVYVKGFTSGRADIQLDVPAEIPTIQNAIQREIRRPQPRVEQARYSQNNENHFVAVTYMGDGGESARGGRIVRVDVPRSTLFAMGFDVSLENDFPTVKADLLIGPDGVTRAVRLVE
ncbi:MAG: hypothetical protein ABL984_11050 [Pyrinomonadaceae bacterium]